MILSAFVILYLFCTLNGFQHLHKHLIIKCKSVGSYSMPPWINLTYDLTASYMTYVIFVVNIICSSQKVKHNHLCATENSAFSLDKPAEQIWKIPANRSLQRASQLQQCERAWGFVLKETIRESSVFQTVCLKDKRRTKACAVLVMLSFHCFQRKAQHHTNYWFPEF